MENSEANPGLFRRRMGKLRKTFQNPHFYPVCHPPPAVGFALPSSLPPGDNEEHPRAGMRAVGCWPWNHGGKEEVPHGHPQAAVTFLPQNRRRSKGSLWVSIPSNLSSMDPEPTEPWSTRQSHSQHSNSQAWPTAGDYGALEQTRGMAVSYFWRAESSMKKKKSEPRLW